MKKKGSSLLLTMCIISVLITFSFMLISQVALVYKFTIKNEQKDKLTLLAESGVEKGFVALKQKLTKTPRIFEDDSSVSFNSNENFEFKEDDVNVIVRFSYDRGNDGIEFSKGYYFKIVSEAKNTVTNASKKITAIILKSDISNAYYDTMFGNVLTTLDTVKNNNNTSFNMQYQKNPLTLDGSMYLQGGTININPDTFSYTSGKIVANSKELSTRNEMNSLVEKIYVSSDTTIDSSIESKVHKISPDYLPVLSVRKVEANPGLDDNMIIFYNTRDAYGNLRYTNNNTGYIVKASNEYSESGATLVTFKIVKGPGAASTFNWSTFVQDVKDFIMRYMVKVNGNGYTGSRPAGGNYGTAFENAYKGMYKLYLIEGDVVIKTPGTVSGYINHVIYTEGKCTLDRGDNPFIKFENSSVMAKTIEIKDLGSGYVELHGIKRLDEVAGGGALSPFSIGNRAKINQFCIQHLDGYGDALRFKVHKWIEE